jgi:Domain of unknown function (DUF1906)/Putative peptidoglycan binding domain
MRVLGPARRLAALLSGGVTAVAVAGTAGPAHAAPVSDVAFHGYHLRVPSDWPVVDLTAHPRTCVRFDHHAVYLGRPGADQDCPARGAGARTEAIVVQPLDDGAVAGLDGIQVVPAGRAAPDRLTARTGHEVRLAVPAAGVLVTAGYGDDISALNRVLTGAALDGSARATPVPAGVGASPQAVTPAISAASTNYTGDGFDTCNTPSQSLMDAWTSTTAYRAIGIYFAGAHRLCSSQPNLTPTWLTTQASHNWHFIPIYVGTQASSLGSTAASKGTAEADDAVNAAAALGIPPGSVLYCDMEAYSSTFTSNVLAYVNAWTAELHARGYKAGAYGSLSSLVHDLNANYGAASPDVIWFASWTGVKNTDTSFISTGNWADHQRIHQYSGDVTESHGGFTLQIDGDYMDVQVAGDSGPPPTPDWPLVSNGDTGERVRTVQYLLDEHGATLSVDGVFGPATTAAVKAFQSAHGLTVDGIVGPMTWSALVVTVQEGSTGNAVRAVQSQLTAHGIATTVDGDFGPATDASVRTYQSGVGITVTGVVDTTTWRFLVA